MSRTYPPLEVLHLKKAYRLSSKSEYLAVNDVSFSIEAGECFGLLGPNGAGKSTTIQCIAGFYPPTSGSIRIDGMDVHANPRVARHRLGFCPQEDTLDTDFSVLDQLVRHATFFRIPVSEARIKAEAMLAQFDLADKARLPVESLSGGMKRRLQVARAFLTDPKVAVLDEPTTGLDPEARRSLWDVILKARRGGTAILLSTHYMDEAERLCDRIGIIHRGKILDIASPDQLIGKYVGTELIEEEVRPGARWRRPPNLEDVYLKMTGTRLEEGEQ